ncbi:MAG: hypothetical protein ACI8P0_001898 [Planctomycetaceae bacterium]|jgi:hypothetical protein
MRLGVNESGRGASGERGCSAGFLANRSAVVSQVASGRPLRNGDRAMLDDIQMEPRLIRQQRSQLSF